MFVLHEVATAYCQHVVLLAFHICIYVSLVRSPKKLIKIWLICIFNMTAKMVELCSKHPIFQSAVSNYCKPHIATTLCVAFNSTHLADLNTLGVKITPELAVHYLLVVSHHRKSPYISYIYLISYILDSSWCMFLEQSSLTCNEMCIKRNTTPVTCMIPQYSSDMVLITCSG